MRTAPRPFDRFQQLLAALGGATLGYLALVDWRGLWFYAPWERWPWMLGGALVTWGAFAAIQRDPHISWPARRALWWGLLGLLGGYAVQVIYLWNRAGAGQPGTLFKNIMTIKTVSRPELAGGTPTKVIAWSSGWMTDPHHWATILLWVLLAMAIVAVARCGAWHLDHGLRRAADPDHAVRTAEYLRQQRLLLVWSLLPISLLVIALGLDPRPLDFSEALALHWLLQHGAIFGFLAGFGIETRRCRYLKMTQSIG